MDNTKQIILKMADRIHQILALELPDLKEFKYSLVNPGQFGFELKTDRELDCEWLGKLLGEKGIDAFAVLGIGEGKFIIDVDLDELED